MRALLVALLILSSAPTLAAAQRAPLPIAAGDRVRLRVRIAPELREGILMSVDTTTLTLRNAPGDGREAAELPAGRLDTIPFSTIRTMHVHRPSASQSARSAVGWSIVGAAGGAVLGFLSSAIIFDRGRSSGAEPILSAAVGAVGGAAVGFVWGVQHPSHWEAIALPRTSRR